MRGLESIFFALIVGSVSPVLVAQRVFDGRTLAGWRGDTRYWSVRDGCIVGAHDGSLAANTFLVLDGRAPVNFTLRASVRIDGANHSGIQYRSQLLPGEGYGVAGPQCGVHGNEARYAMWHEEQGAGLVAERGQGVVLRDAGRSVLGGVAARWRCDAAQWHTIEITAVGGFSWHSIDGRLATVVKDERSAAPRSGVIALQLHAGPATTVWCRDVELVEHGDDAAAMASVPVPDAMQALLEREQRQLARPGAIAPAWIWDQRASAGQEVFFRRTFVVGAVPANARLVASCDNHCRVFVNGERVAASDVWEQPVTVDVTAALRVGDNVVAVHGSNDGGPAALALHLAWREGDAEAGLVTDATWRCFDDDPDGWNATSFDAAAWRPATVFGRVGDDGAPWTRALGPGAIDAFVRDDAPQVAVVETRVTRADGSATGEPVMRLFDVPRSLGSWVALCADAKGRLYASAQRGGLYRVQPAAVLGATTTIERVPVELGGCQGLLWFRDALYAVQNGGASGLYRVTDSNGDDVLDRVELLRALEGEGEHGPHSVVVAPDGANLLVLCGNHTKLPELAASRVARHWQEDRLLPRLEDPNDYWEGISPPGGWVCLVDPDGTRWELLCCGFRNPYDLAVLPNGLVVTFDADMEWDMGLPWYRPTRLLAVESGVDYGWRIGSAKWPTDWPEAPPALQDIGPGSPVGMAYVRGDRSSFLLSLDWTFGTVYRDREPWLTGAPLPLTDLATARDRSGRSVVYLLTGGRGLPTSLLAVPLDDAADSSVRADGLLVAQWGTPGAWSAKETRSAAQILDEASAAAVRPPGGMRPLPAPHWQRARIALERLPVAQWRDIVLAVDAAKPARSLTGLLALARHGNTNDLQPMLDALGALPFEPLSAADRIAWLRVHALALLRLGPATDAQRTALGERLLPLFPTGDERQDADLAELLACVDARGFLDRAVPLLSPMHPSPPPPWAEVASRNPTYGSVIAAMLASPPPTGQIALANALRTVKSGWTLDQRRTFFAFVSTARTRRGGSSYDGYVQSIANAAWATCSSDERPQLAAAHAAAIADRPKFRATPPKGPGRVWQLADADALLRQPLDAEDLAAGRNLFHAASCAMCHFFAGEGGNLGPDLTSLGSKFTARDAFASIVAPSQVASDQYAGSVVTRRDGSTLFGFVSKAFRGDTEVLEVMSAEPRAEIVRIPVAEVGKIEKSPLSPMPAGLVNTLSGPELRQLLAFLLSRGQGLGRTNEAR